jgi:arginine decarboxylase
MTNSYLDLVKQTFNFPQEGFEVDEGNLYFNGLGSEGSHS